MADHPVIALGHRIHNAEARRHFLAIVRPILQRGSPPTDALVLLESIALGVILAAASGHEEAAIDLLADGLRERLADIRGGKAGI